MRCQHMVVVGGAAAVAAAVRVAERVVEGVVGGGIHFPSCGLFGHPALVPLLAEMRLDGAILLLAAEDVY